MNDGAPKLWGGRFAGGQDAAFRSFNQSLPFDQRLIQEDIQVNRAWAAALAAAGVLSAAECQELDQALADLSHRVAEQPELLATSQAEDVHAFVEAALTDALGPLGKRIHTGRSRNDQVATDFRLWTKAACTRLDDLLVELMRALVGFAQREASTPVPGYTHLQRAQPITFGHHALAYVEMLQRDRDRLLAAKQRMDECPLGSGALAGTTFAIDRKALAQQLGFARPSANSLDAVSDRDFVAEVLFVAGLCGVHLSRLCEDWIFFASQEAGFLELADDCATGSSIMPQKKNPDGLELVRGKSARLLGRLAGFLACLKGLPLAYNKDLQEDKEALFDAVDTLTACLAVARRTVETTGVRAERAAAACRLGYLNATDLADYLVEQGVPFRDAHEQVGRLVRLAIERGVELEALPLADIQRVAPAAGPCLFPRLELQEVLSRRNLPGGTDPKRVLKEAQRWQKRLA